MIAAWKRQAIEGMSGTFTGAGERRIRIGGMNEKPD